MVGSKFRVIESKEFCGSCNLSWNNNFEYFCFFGSLRIIESVFGYAPTIARMFSSSVSRTTSLGLLSSQIRRNTGWRGRSSRVHSVSFTWQTFFSFTQWQRFISAAVNPWSHRLRPAAGTLEKGQLSTRIFRNSLKQRAQKLIAEAGSDSASKFEILAFAKANEQGAEILADLFRFGISADHELLLFVELDFDPCSSAPPGLVPGTAAFSDQAFESHFLGTG
jgi:hypothetical protein